MEMLGQPLMATILSSLKTFKFRFPQDLIIGEADTVAANQMTEVFGLVSQTVRIESRNKNVDRRTDVSFPRFAIANSSKMFVAR